MSDEWMSAALFAAATESMKQVAHYGLEYGKDLITSTMAGVELCMGIGFRQSLC